MKARRRNTIHQLVRDHEIESQDMLQGLLAEAGHDVTQATLSRDLRALGIVKVPTAGGSARYQAQGRGPDRSIGVANMRAFLREILVAGNLLVIKTRVGGAQPVGLALDQLQLTGLVGTIAGDDTVLAVIADGTEPTDVMNRIWQAIEP